MFVCCLLLVGCSGDRFTAINPHQNFIASINILQPSITFFDQQGEELTTWSFERAYTGGTLIQKDRILLYGHQLSEAHLYELSTGKKVATIETGIGTTNAYYDKSEKKFFLTNSKSNKITSYDLQGNKLHDQKLHNYPMSMTASNGLLYVVNYKDTVLSVVSMEDLQVVDEWSIEKSSHGILILEDKGVAWIGGHGEGNRPNETIDVYNLESGEKTVEIALPLMPVGIAQNGKEVAVISHGENKLYVTNEDGDIQWQAKIGANPFSVVYFQEYIAVAGYDDGMVYFVKDGRVVKKMTTSEGPFQLIVRED